MDRGKANGPQEGGPLTVGNHQFWRIEDACAALQRAGITESDAENIAGMALAAARRGLLVTRSYPAGAELLRQHTAGGGGRPWYFFASDFNAWLDAVRVTAHRLPAKHAAALERDNRERELSAMRVPPAHGPSSVRVKPPPEKTVGGGSAGGLYFRRSRAPEPITPIRSSSNGAYSRPAYPRPTWRMWKQVKQIEVWQAACLCMDIDPTDDLLHATSWPDGLSDRIHWIARFLSDEGVFTSVHHDGRAQFYSRVLLREFAALAARLWPDEVPLELRQLAAPVDAASMHSNQARGMQDAGPGWSLKEPERDHPPMSDLIRLMRKMHEEGRQTPPTVLDVLEELHAALRRRETMDSVLDVQIENGQIVGVEYKNKRGAVEEIDVERLQKRIARTLVVPTSG